MVDKLTLVASISMMVGLLFSQQSLGQVCNCTCPVDHERKNVCDELNRLDNKSLSNSKEITNSWIPVREFVQNLKKEADDVEAGFKNTQKTWSQNFVDAMRTCENLSDLSKRMSQLEQNTTRVESFINDLQEDLGEAKKAINELEGGLAEEQKNRLILEEMLKEEQRIRKKLEKTVSEEKSSENMRPDGLAKEQNGSNDREREPIAAPHGVEKLLLLEGQNKMEILKEIIKEDQTKIRNLEMRLEEEQKEILKLKQELDANSKNTDYIWNTLGIEISKAEKMEERLVQIENVLSRYQDDRKPKKQISLPYDKNSNPFMKTSRI